MKCLMALQGRYDFWIFPQLHIILGRNLEERMNDIDYMQK